MSSLINTIRCQSSKTQSAKLQRSVIHLLYPLLAPFTFIGIVYNESLINGLLWLWFTFTIFTLTFFVAPCHTVTGMATFFTHFIHVCILDYIATIAIIIITAPPMTHFLWLVQMCLAWFITFSIVVSSYFMSPQLSPDS